MKTITVRDIWPTCKMVVMFSDSPSRIMANFNIFLEVNFSPVANTSVLRTNWLRNMPMNMAITAELIRWMGNRLSSQQASSATMIGSTIPGSSFMIFMVNLLFAEGTGLHSFPVSATISAVKKRRKETVATERIQRESGR